MVSERELALSFSTLKFEITKSKTLYVGYFADLRAFEFPTNENKNLPSPKINVESRFPYRNVGNC